VSGTRLYLLPTSHAKRVLQVASVETSAYNFLQIALLFIRAWCSDLKDATIYKAALAN
jgi:hypothetical protein